MIDSTQYYTRHLILSVIIWQRSFCWIFLNVSVSPFVYRNIRNASQPGEELCASILCLYLIKPFHYLIENDIFSIRLSNKRIHMFREIFPYVLPTGGTETILYITFIVSLYWHQLDLMFNLRCSQKQWTKMTEKVTSRTF